MKFIFDAYNKECNSKRMQLLTILDLVSAIFESINSKITSKIIVLLLLTPVKILKLRFTTSLLSTLYKQKTYPYECY